MMPVVVGRKSSTRPLALATGGLSFLFILLVSIRIAVAETAALSQHLEDKDGDLSIKVSGVSVPYQSLADSLMHTASAQLVLATGEVHSLTMRGSHENVFLINGRQVLTAEGRKSFNISPFESLPDNLLGLMPSPMVRNIHLSTHMRPASIEGASGAVLNIFTADPFDHQHDETFVVNFSGINTALPSDTGYAIFSRYLNTFSHDKLGLAFSVARSSKERRQDGLDANTGFRRFGNADDAIDALDNVISVDSNNDGIPGLVHRDIQFRQINDMREKTGISSMLRWRPIDSLEFYVDGFYSSIHSDSRAYGVGFLNCCLFREPRFSPNDVLLAASVQSKTEITTDFVGSESTLLNSAIGMSWKSAALSVVAELAVNDADSNMLSDRYDFETNTSSFVDFDFKKGEVPSLNYRGIDLMDASSMSLIGINTDEKKFSTSDIALRLDARWEFSLPTMLALEFGGRFNEMTHRSLRHHTSIPTSISLIDLDNYTTKHSSPNFFYADKHNIDLRYLVADHRSLYGCTSLIEFLNERERALCVKPENPYTAVDIEEKLSALYFGLSHQRRVAEKMFSANVGLRYVHRTSASLAPGVDTLAPSFFSMIEKENSYVLPTLDLHLDFSEVLRVSVRGSESIGLPASEAINGRIKLLGLTTARAGNPELAPMEVTQLSLSTEWRHLDNSLLSLALFRKRMTAPFVSSILENHIVEGHNFPVKLLTTVNGSERILNGLEWRYRQDFSFLPPLFKGLSAEFNYAYIDSGAQNNGLPIGVSRSNANAVLLYQKQRFAYRLAYRWREAYINATDLEGINTFVHDYADLSATVSWNIDENIRMHFDAINLSDARHEQYALFQEAVARDLGIGRSYRLTLSVGY